MKIFLVRHGETQGNAQGVFYGRTNLCLTDKGVEQSSQIAHWLSGITFDLALTSTLDRAIMTADLILAHQKIGCQREARLNEIDFGAWEMCHFNEIAQNYPADWEQWVKDNQTACPTQGESFAHFRSRVHEFADELREWQEPKNLLIVAHQGVLSLLLAHLLHMPASAMWHFPFSHDAYSVIDNQSDFISLHIFNGQTDYLSHV